MKNLSELKETLIPFIAHRIKSGVLWHKNLSDIEIKKIQAETSYLISNRSDISVFNGEPLLSEEKVFYAERYGGDGISRNGGGARCGFDGQWQVKGIGANPLIGKDSKQVDGELTMTGAMLEVLWGSLMEKLLPFGAVPNVVVLLTDQAISGKKHAISFRSQDLRTLLVREPTIRPAHFCRAPYYLPYAAMLSQQHDASRVENLISKLIGCLPHPLSMDEEQWHNLSPEEKAGHGLVELTSRLATQIAYCRTRHLVMRTSPSNCDMSGRLLDFHGVRHAFPADREQGIQSYIRYEKLNGDAQILLNGMLDLCFYLAKYIFGSAFQIYVQRQIINAFNSSYQRTSWVENLRIAGFDVEFLHTVCTYPSYAAMGNRLQLILDMSVGSFTQKLGVGQRDSHPAIALLHNLIDTLQVKKAEIFLKNFQTTGESFSFAFQHLCCDYLHYKTNQGKSGTEVRDEMKNTIARRLQSRTFMNREVILKEINSYQGTINDIALQIKEYQSHFEKKAIDILK
ncbi:MULTISPECIES: hypothetical protein [Photorhabdus]|uniref:MchC protein n=2 Tax=Photorhabdus asymbiotica TaxID=291112 RepID=C7BRN1_PHOAA|nr:hypothetical protein [Photorhabdus asymbiotica]RKS66620.1 hypothetical protein BDD30_0948 [Photorhabdus asymbiotica]CAQ83432.1 conserved hypothetical protein [Photorhabdus asymbiotica]